MRGANVEMEWLGSGYCEADCTKVREGWKFASRRLFEFGMAPSFRTFMVS